jgi:hypothetical protein
LAIRREAATAVLRTDCDHRLTLAATLDTDGKLRALLTVHEGSVQHRLYGLTREHRRRRRWAIHFESGSLNGVIKRHGLQSGRQRRRVASGYGGHRCGQQNLVRL